MTIKKKQIPNAVIGDLDSIRPEVRAYYAARGADVLRERDQYSTDFTKALRLLRVRAGEIVDLARTRTRARVEKEGDRGRGHVQGQETGTGTGTDTDTEAAFAFDVVVLGGIAGRVDHAFATVNTFFVVASLPPDSPPDHVDAGGFASVRPSPSPAGRMYLVSESSISFVLAQGRNVVRTRTASAMTSAATADSGAITAVSSHHDHHDRHHHHDVIPSPDDDPATSIPTPEFTSPVLAKNVGLIPLAGPATLTTTGFEWDVTSWRTALGGGAPVSTSNHLRPHKVDWRQQRLGEEEQGKEVEEKEMEKEGAVVVETDVPLLFTVELADVLKADATRE